MIEQNQFDTLSHHVGKVFPNDHSKRWRETAALIERREDVLLFKYGITVHTFRQSLSLSARNSAALSCSYEK